MDKICQHCLEPFVATNPNKVFCTRPCKNRAMNKTYNRGSKQKNRGLIKKAFFIKSLGGKCSKCGYDKNLTCLTFHHTNPKKKTMPLDVRSFANYKHNDVVKEVSGCIVVCRNCHGEIEHPNHFDWQEKW